MTETVGAEPGCELGCHNAGPSNEIITHTVPLGSGMAGQTATTDFSKEETFLGDCQLSPCFFAFSSSPASWHLHHSPYPANQLHCQARTCPMEFGMGPDEPDFPGAEADSTEALGANSFLPSVSPECFSHK